MSPKTDKQWIKEYEDLELLAYAAKARGDRGTQRDIQGRLFAMTQLMPEATLRRIAARPIIGDRSKRITEDA